MAIANGTCVSFCYQKRHIIWLPHESHAGMSLPTADLRLQPAGLLRATCCLLPATCCAGVNAA